MLKVIDDKVYKVCGCGNKEEAKSENVYQDILGKYIVCSNCEKTCRQNMMKISFVTMIRSCSGKSIVQKSIKKPHSLLVNR